MNVEFMEKLYKQSNLKKHDSFFSQIGKKKKKIRRSSVETGMFHQMQNKSKARSCGSHVSFEAFSARAFLKKNL